MKKTEIFFLMQHLKSNLNLFSIVVYLAVFLLFFFFLLFAFQRKNWGVSAGLNIRYTDKKFHKRKKQYCNSWWNQLSCCHQEISLKKSTSNYSKKFTIRRHIPNIFSPQLTCFTGFWSWCWWVKQVESLLVIN